MYKQALQIGLRVNTPRGPLSVEQLFQLSMTDLKTTAKNLNNLLVEDDSKGLEFLEEAESKNDKVIKLSFDIVKDIYVTKKEAAKAIKDAAAIKEHNQKILQLITSKKDAELEGKSIEELEAMLQQ